MSALGAEPPEVETNPSTGATPVSTMKQGGGCLTSEYEPVASINPRSYQYLYGDTPGHPWLHHIPDEDIRGVLI